MKEKVFVLPTDTLYGICASALDKKSVERIYAVKGRDEKKPFIILVSSVKDIEKFGVSPKLLQKEKELFTHVWPGKVSIIIPLEKKYLAKFRYLHRGTGKLAFRFPRKKALVQVLKKTGPLVAPSANPQGLHPAETVRDAKKYFKDMVDRYIAGGRLTGAPSTIIEITKKGDVKVVRQGARRVQWESINH